MNNHTVKDIDDVDDDTFISRKPQNYIFADKKANDIQERTSRSMLNTRALVQESEMVGQSTLEQLSSQRETLERVENDLDHINTTTRATQKHLNNMRSFFGGIKSLFSSSNSNTATPPIVPSTTSGVGMTKSATLANVPSATTTSGSSLMNSQSGGIQKKSFQAPAAPTASSQLGRGATLDNPNDEFEANLSEIGFGLGRLKDMAMKLGDEIGDQNEILDRITDKSERAGDSIKLQNRQMQQLLKKG